MSDKHTSRLRRAKRTRMRIKNLQMRHADLPCITVHRTPRHIGAQVVIYDALTKHTRVVCTASTLQKDIREKCKYTGNADAAKVVGEELAKKMLAKGYKKVAFDRSGFKYHGRVQALADAAREGGIEF